MRIGRVVGNVVSTIKDRSHENYKLLIVKECDDSGHCDGEEMIVIDTACAGEGDYVLMLDDGGSSRMMMENKHAPVDSIIVGVLDYLPWREN